MNIQNVKIGMTLHTDKEDEIVEVVALNSKDKVTIFGAGKQRKIDAEKLWACEDCEAANA